MTTPVAGIIEIDDKNNQKFKQHNEGLRSLEAFSIGAAVTTTELDSANVVSPTEGDIYIINGAGANAWAGLDFEVVQWESPAWKVLGNFVGLVMPVLDTETYWRYTGVTGQEWVEVRDRFTEKTITLPYDLLESDHGKELIVVSGTGNFNIPDTTTDFPNYFTCLLSLDGIGDVTVQRAAGGTTDLILPSGNQQLDTEGTTVTVRKRTGNIWKVDGNLSA